MTTSPDDAFRPVRVLSNPHLQSILASSALRRWKLLRNGPLLPGTQEHVLDCGAAVRLQGFHTPAPDPADARGLVVLLHGWEGCERSSYLLSLAGQLRRAGYAIFRLNFRDHGDTHHLNEGLFHSCRLDEVVGAVGAIAERFPARPLMLVGFSLGGNFALRVALRAPRAALPLRRVVAVNPVVDPDHTLRGMERGPRVYERYFLRKWRRSLRRKQALFPRRYEFGAWSRRCSLRELTDRLVRRYAGFASLEQYLDGYSIAGQRLRGLAIPATIVMAADDPIVPVGDVRALDAGADAPLGIEIQQLGGHVGFLENLGLASWADRRVEAILAGAADTPSGQRV